MAEAVIAPDRARQTGGRFWSGARWLRRHPIILIGLVLLGLMLVMAVLAPLFSTHDPVRLTPTERLRSPSLEHWFGTDHLGRDVYSRVIYGSRISLIVGFSVAALATVLGLAIGLVTGFVRKVDAVIMRIMDGLFAFPIIILAIAMMAVMGFGVRNVIIAVAVGFIAPFARVTRGDVLAVKEEPYIEAARLAGVGSFAIIFQHVLPNVLAPIIVQGALRVSGAIITESGLSFLGLGPPPPTPAWGRMIAEGQAFIVMAPHVSTIPGIALMLAIVALNLLGDGLRDTLDPRMRR